MKPDSRRLFRGPPRRLGQVRFRHLIQHLVLADASDVGHASLLQPLQQPRFREPRVHPHDHRAAQTPSTPVHHSQCQLQSPVPQIAGSGIEFPVDQVSRLAATRHQPQVHRLPVVSAPLASRLTPMDLHRETVHVQEHPLFPPRCPFPLLFPIFSLDSPSTFHHLDPTAGQFRHRLVQDRKVLLPAQGVQQPRQRRLRRQSLLLLQGRRAPARVARHPQAGIVAQAVRVGLVAPALSQQQESSVQQIRQPMADRARVSRIVQPLGQPVDDAGPVHHLPLRQGARIGAEPLRSNLDSDGSVERGTDLGYCLRHGVFLLLWWFCSHLNHTTKDGHAISFAGSLERKKILESLGFRTS